MSGNVVRVGSNYKIQAVSGGSITFDTGSNVGNVIITGSLSVLGSVTQLSTTNTDIKDNIIVLNVGDQGPYITSNASGTSGIQINRGIFGSPGNTYNDDAYIVFDERISWVNPVTNTTKTGAFSFKTASGGISGIRTNSIDTNGGSLNLLGRGTGVVTVSGTSNYEYQVLNYSTNYSIRDKDIIPNIRAVYDLVSYQILVNSSDNIKRDDTQFIVYDNNIGQVIATFDTGGTPSTSVRFNHPAITNARLNVSVGSSITITGSGVTHLDGTWTVTTAVSTASFFIIQTALSVTASNTVNVSSIININNVKSNAKLYVDGALITEFQQDHADLYGIRIQDTTITATNSNTNLILDVSGTASVLIKTSTKISSNASSSSSTTGALIVNGGTGIGGNLNVNGNISGNGSLTITGSGTVTINSSTKGSIDNVDIGNTVRGVGKFTSVNISDATGSTSTSTGALVVTGGLGVGGIIRAGSIQDTSIGSLTPNTGKFTSLEAQTININTTTLTYQVSDPAVDTTGVKLYSKNIDLQTTGIYFINSTTSGELISKSKALAYSILFG